MSRSGRRRARLLAGLLVASALTVAPAGAPLQAQRAGQRPIQRPPRPIDATTPTRGEWGDRGDGTYANPVLPSDFSDIDAIRVGRDYYAISSTFQYSPGMVVLHSRDLVNWRIAGHAVSDLTQIGPELNWDRMNRPARGIWAGAIRHHAGRFWVYFGTPDEGFFMTTAERVEGPWTPLKAVWRVAGWDDPCPFWDDDGRLYMVASKFQRDSVTGRSYDIHLFELTADGERIVPGSDRIIHQSRGSEASKLFKRGGTYYHYYSHVTDEGRVPMMARASSLAGPWERRQIGHVNGPVDKEPNQGGLIELPDGRWYFLSHQGKGDWEGRAGVLLPVFWRDGWPILGSPGPDGIGNMVWRGRKPIPGGAPSTTSFGDEFNAPVLGRGWEWNYQPRAGFWSLTDRPGHLRLRAFPALRPGDFTSVGNVLTQRSMRTPFNEVTVKMDLTGMTDGQEAGIAHYAKSYCTFGVSREQGVRRMSSNCDGTRTLGPSVSASVVWLRSTWGFDGLSRYSFSTDGKSFVALGGEYQLTWGHYRGDRIGIFTTANNPGAGHVDVDAVRYVVRR